MATLVVAPAIAVATWALVDVHKPQSFTKHCGRAHFTEGLAWWTLVVGTAVVASVACAGFLLRSPRPRPRRRYVLGILVGLGAALVVFLIGLGTIVGSCDQYD